MIQHLRRSWPLFSLALLAAAPLASQLAPLGPEFRINEADLHTKEAPRLALDGAGTLLAVWPGLGSNEDALLVRTFDRSGRPLGPERVFSAPGYRLLYPDVTALSPGRFLLAWDRPYVADGLIAARFLGTDGAPLGPEIRLDLDSHPDGAGHPQVAGLPSGGFLATWNSSLYGPLGWEPWIVARRFDENGAPAGAETRVSNEWETNSWLAALQDGGFLSLWEQPPAPFPFPAPLLPVIRGRRFDAAGQPVTQILTLFSVKVAASPDGRFVAASTGRSLDVQRNDSEVYASLYDREGRRLQPAGTLVAEGPGNQVLEAVAMDEAGRFLVVWSNNLERDDPYVDSDLFARLYSASGQPLGPAFAVASGPGDQFGATVVEKNGEWVISYVSEPANVYWGGEIYARRFAACATDGSSLCLADRFRADVSFQSNAGHGTGQAVPLTGDTGAFWFFAPENIELLVKAIDGRALNGHFWIFYGALSNVAYDMTVTDTVTGEQKVYHNPAGTMASRADTRAFAAGPDFSLTPALAADAVRQHTAPLIQPVCFDGPQNLCLGGPYNQFQVEVTWKVPGTGQTGTGKAVPLTGETGYFWFFSAENVELVVKVLDGRGVNGKYWVFYGALSDVEYTIQVTDKLSGKVKTYHNPAGTMASRADTSAF